MLLPLGYVFGTQYHNSQRFCNKWKNYPNLPKQNCLGDNCVVSVDNHSSFTSKGTTDPLKQLPYELQV